MEKTMNEKIIKYKKLVQEAEGISFALLVNENIIFGPRRLKKANDKLMEDMVNVSKKMDDLNLEIKNYKLI